jgi:CheY-like chemotaxis protein
VNKRVGILGLDLRVLVAEDNPINATVLTTILGHLGCTCKLAKDGAQAVALFREEKFDLILMDCQMPVLDGYEATRQIRTIEAKRQRGEPIRIVAVTANAFAEDQQRCLEAGMDDHLSKPFTPERLSAVLLPQNPKKPPNPPLVGSPVLSGGFEELVGIVGIAGAGKLASRWVKEVPERLARIRNAMLEGDWKRIRREAHSILGTSGLFGLSELERLARLIEAEINEMHYLSAASMEAFEAAIGKAQRALMDRIDEPARAQPAEPGAKSRKRHL